MHHETSGERHITSVVCFSLSVFDQLLSGNVSYTLTMQFAALAASNLIPEVAVALHCGSAPSSKTKPADVGELEVSMVRG